MNCCVVQWSMALECYYSPRSRVCRVFPLFFGKRSDAFGKIGCLFHEEEYLCLPHIIPRASLDLAARLLRSMGVEPRPEFFELTISSIVQHMKKFLCIFAWTIEQHDAVTSESVKVLLQVLQQSLDEERTAHAHASATSPAKGLSESAAASAGESACSLPLKRCVEILQEGLGVTSSNGPQAVAEALENLGDADVEANCNAHKSLLAKLRYLACDVLGYTE
jgi:hypothetical protein